MIDFKLQLPLYSLLMLMLLGCKTSPVLPETDSGSSSVSRSSSTSQASADKSVSGFIISQHPNGNKKDQLSEPILNGKTLTLGAIKIKNWPLENLACEFCDVSIERTIHPDGPTTWVTLKGETVKATTWIMSSFQYRFSVGPWFIQHKDHQVVITDRTSKKASSVNAQVLSPLAMNTDADCSLLWANKEFLEQPKSHIANDVAHFKSQFIIQCLN